MMVKDLVAYVVSRINSERSAAINLNVAPKVLFTDLCMDYKWSSPWHLANIAKFMMLLTIRRGRGAFLVSPFIRAIIRGDLGLF